MNTFDRAGDAWYGRLVVHACIVCILLMAAAALLVDARIEDSSSGPPPDRPPPTRVVRLSAGESAVIAPRAPAAEVAAKASGG